MDIATLQLTKENNDDVHVYQGSWYEFYAPSMPKKQRHYCQASNSLSHLYNNIDDTEVKSMCSIPSRKKQSILQISAVIAFLKTWQVSDEVYLFDNPNIHVIRLDSSPVN